MGKNYRDLKDYAISDIDRWAGQHVIKEEPVRSFRFHGHYTDKKYDSGRVDHRPGFATFTPVQSVKFSYTSTYCFTLTWTPGHMTIVGDLGELTVVHYHAMPTLDEACRWLLSDDYHYLLSKTNVRREYDRDATFDALKKSLNAEVIDHLLGEWNWQRTKKYDGDRDELRSWRRQKPTAGELNDEGENEASWLEHRPLTALDDSQRDCWRRWHEVRKTVSHWEDQYDVRKSEDRHAMLDEARGHFETEEGAAQFLWGDLGGDDPYIAHEYPSRAFIQIAAIQFGCRMILAQLSRKEAA